MRETNFFSPSYTLKSERGREKEKGSNKERQKEKER